VLNYPVVEEALRKRVTCQFASEFGIMEAEWDEQVIGVFEPLYERAQNIFCEVGWNRAEKRPYADIGIEALFLFPAFFNHITFGNSN
jgi:hypothetical protein